MKSEYIKNSSFVFALWVAWGMLAFGIASSGIAQIRSFVEFYTFIGKFVPTVRHPPPREILDPSVASSFLALIWASSPVLLYVFSRIPRSELFSLRAWSSPTSGRVLLAIGVMVLCAAMSLTYHWDEKRFGNALISHPLGFALMASLVSALPWYTVVFVKAWWSRVKELTRNAQ